MNQQFNGTFYQPPQTQGGTPQMQEAYAGQLFYQQKRRQEKHEIITAGIALGCTIIASLVLQVLSTFFLKGADMMDAYNQSAIFQNCFNILAVDIIGLLIPFTVLHKTMKSRFVTDLIPHKEVGVAKTAAWVAFGMGICIAANLVTNVVIEIFKQFGYELTQPDLPKPDSIYACIVIVFSTALAPALIEEYSLRCCTLGVLRRHGKAFAVVATSIVFGLLHGNVIQFVFAFTIGLILGYITVQTDSVVPAMLIHGLNNGMSVTQDIVVYAGGEKAGETALLVMFYGWAALAVIGFVYLLKTRSLLPEKTQRSAKPPYALSLGEKVLCLLPGLIVPFVVLIALTMATIEPIK